MMAAGTGGNTSRWGSNGTWARSTVYTLWHKTICLKECNSQSCCVVCCLLFTKRIYTYSSTLEIALWIENGGTAKRKTGLTSKKLTLWCWPCNRKWKVMRKGDVSGGAKWNRKRWSRYSTNVQPNKPQQNQHKNCDTGSPSAGDNTCRKPWPPLTPCTDIEERNATTGSHTSGMTNHGVLEKNSTKSEWNRRRGLSTGLWTHLWYCLPSCPTWLSIGLFQSTRSCQTQNRMNKKKGSHNSSSCTNNGMTTPAICKSEHKHCNDAEQQQTYPSYLNHSKQQKHCVMQFHMNMKRKFSWSCVPLMMMMMTAATDFPITGPALFDTYFSRHGKSYLLTT